MFDRSKIVDQNETNWIEYNQSRIWNFKLLKRTDWECVKLSNCFANSTDENDINDQLVENKYGRCFTL